MQRLTDKLDYYKIKLYKVNKQISKVAFRVKLSNYIKVYLTFYISKLKLAKGYSAKQKLYIIELLED